VLGATSFTQSFNFRPLFLRPRGHKWSTRKRGPSLEAGLSYARLRRIIISTPGTIYPYASIPSMGVADALRSHDIRHELHGVMVLTVAKGGLMYEASVGGQKFKYEAY
jgi:hypothetical protein